MGPIFPLLWNQPPRGDDADNPLKVMHVTPWKPEFEAFEKRFGLRIVTMYGTTETGIVTASPFEEKIRPGSCGKPLPSYEVKIVDDHDVEVGAGNDGRDRGPGQGAECSDGRLLQHA